jgi:6,7-dimethyl-8-ribityllumazine synthase
LPDWRFALAGFGTERMKMSAERNETRGGLRAEGMRFGVVVSRFNSFITERLLAAAIDTLRAAGAVDSDVEIVRVPGSFEIPVAAKQLAGTGRVEAILCIGCILRGETSHYDYVCSESARGIMLAQMDTGVPMSFCVLTCDTLEQAIDRAGLKGGNKGAEAALAAIEMASLARKLAPNAAASPKASPAAASGRKRPTAAARRPRNAR